MESGIFLVRRKYQLVYKMKKAIFILVFGMFSAVLSSAEANRELLSTGACVLQDDEREKIKISDLPADVRNVLEGNDYRGWTITKLYKVVPKNAPLYYEAHLQQKKDVKVMYFDETGKVVDPHKKGSGKPANE